MLANRKSKAKLRNRKQTLVSGTASNTHEAKQDSEPTNKYREQNQNNFVAIYKDM